MDIAYLLDSVCWPYCNKLYNLDCRSNSVRRHCLYWSSPGWLHYHCKNLHILQNQVFFRDETLTSRCLSDSQKCRYDTICDHFFMCPHKNMLAVWFHVLAILYLRELNIMQFICKCQRDTQGKTNIRFVVHCKKFKL